VTGGYEKKSLAKIIQRLGFSDRRPRQSDFRILAHSGSRASYFDGLVGSVSNFAQMLSVTDYLERSRPAIVDSPHIHKIKQLRSVYRRHP